MKAVIVIVVLLAFLGCSKSSNRQEETVILRAKEFGTGLPLADVILLLRKCSDYDFVFGCRATTVFTTYTTNANGECRVKAGDYRGANEGILYVKQRYWDTKNGEQMEPEAFVAIALKAGMAYRNGLYIRLATKSLGGLSSTAIFPAPKDSMVAFRVFGNEQNDISWLLFSGGGCGTFCLADTVASGRLAVSPKKFETVNNTLLY